MAQTGTPLTPDISSSRRDPLLSYVGSKSRTWSDTDRAGFALPTNGDNIA